MKVFLSLLGFSVLVLAIAFAPRLTQQNSATALDETKIEETQEAIAWRLIKEGALLVDVRRVEEFEAGHLAGAKLIPHDQVASRLDEFGSDRSVQIVLYCRSGTRAGKAETVLREHGFTNVFNAGGYEPLNTAKP